MYEIAVCTENSCRSQMAQSLLLRLQTLTEQNGLSGLVHVGPASCLGVCRDDGVSVQIGTNLYTGITPDNLDFVFQEYVLSIFAPKVEGSAV